MTWQEFVTKIKEENISIDESGFNKLIQKSKDLSKRGSTIHCPVTSVKNINVYLLMAITTERIIHHKELIDSVNGDIFYFYDVDYTNITISIIIMTFVYMICYNG